MKKKEAENCSVLKFNLNVLYCSHSTVFRIDIFLFSSFQYNKNWEIGQFFKFLATKFVTKVFQKFGDFSGLFENTLLKKKCCFLLFWQLGVKLGNLLWSHLLSGRKVTPLTSKLLDSYLFSAKVSGD